MKACSSCGRQALEGDLFCRKCGSSLADQPSAAASGNPPSDGQVDSPVTGDPDLVKTARGRRSVVLVAVVLVAIVAVSAIVVHVWPGKLGTLRRIGPWAPQTPQSTDAQDAPGSSVLRSYLHDVRPVIRNEQINAEINREWKTPPGAQVFGVHRVMRLRTNGRVTWWVSGKEEGRHLDTVTLRLGAVTPPSSLKQAHRKLVRVFSIEAERWYAFTTCESKRKTAAFRPEYRRWRAKSASLLKRQQRLIWDWYLEVRMEANREGVEVPSRIRSLVKATRALTE